MNLRTLKVLKTEELSTCRIRNLSDVGVDVAHTPCAPHHNCHVRQTHHTHQVGICLFILFHFMGVVKRFPFERIEEFIEQKCKGFS